MEDITLLSPMVIPDDAVASMRPTGDFASTSPWDWSSSLGSPVALTYFLSDAYPENSLSEDGYTNDSAHAWAASQKAAVEQVLAAYAQVAGLIFASAAEGIDALQGVEVAQFQDLTVDLTGEAIAPTVVITDNTPGTAVGNVTYTLAFDEEVTGLASSDFTVLNGSIISVTGSGASYSVVVAPAAGVEGDMSLTLPAGSVTDLAGNANADAAAAAQPIDTKAPGATITDNVPGVANLATTSVVYTLVFSEPILGLDGSDFVVSNVTGGTLSGSGQTWTVTLTPRPGVPSGSIGLTLKAGAITDAAGNPNAAVSAAAQPIDTVAPVAPKLVPTTSLQWLVDPQVTYHTSLGDVVIELDPMHAPATVANLLAYVDTGYYDGTLFHRVVPGFVAQGGGFTSGLVAKPPTYGAIALESANGLSNLRGTVAMARTSAPDSATSQFFVNLVDNDNLDFSSSSNPGYAVFGRVVQGMAVIDSMAMVPTGTVGAFQNVPQTEIIISEAQLTRAGMSVGAEAVLRVDGLESGASWQYSLDAGASWLAGSGNSIVVPEGSYASDAIQVRQTDAAGNQSATAGHFDNALVVDGTAPTVASLTPGDDASKVAVASNLVVTFSEAVTHGAGTITLMNLEGAVLESFDAATSSRLTISGNTLTVDPTLDLAYGTGYALQFAPGSVQDQAGNAYAGGSGYNFTTTLVDPADPKSAYYEIAQKFYVAYFGRPADTGGLANMAQMFSDSGASTDLLTLKNSASTSQTVRDIIDSFGLSQESSNLYAGADTTARVTAVYNFMFNRAPEADGLAFWVGAIDSGVLGLAEAALSIMQGSENWPQDDGLTVVKKITVAQNFTSALDTPAESSAYAGDAAAALVRGMLGGVDKTSDTGSYEPNVLSTISQLVAAHPSATAEMQYADFEGYGSTNIALIGVDELPQPQLAGA